MKIDTNVCVGFQDGYCKNEQGHLFLKGAPYGISVGSVVTMEVSDAGYYHKIWVNGELVTEKHTKNE